MAEAIAQLGVYVVELVAFAELTEPKSMSILSSTSAKFTMLPWAVAVRSTVSKLTDEVRNIAFEPLFPQADVMRITEPLAVH